MRYEWLIVGEDNQSYTRVSSNMDNIIYNIPSVDLEKIVAIIRFNKVEE
jgi:hypothetical protein